MPTAARVATNDVPIAADVARHALAGSHAGHAKPELPEHDVEHAAVRERRRALAGVARRFTFAHTKLCAGDITGEGGIELWSSRKKITRKWASQTDATWMS